MNNNMMASNFNSITVGVGSLTTCHTHVLVSPNAKSSSRGIFSFSLSQSRRSLNIISNPNGYGTTPTRLNTPISAIDSGLEASITDSNENSATLKNAKIVVESGDENKLQLRVDLTGDQTQKVFDKTLANLARSAPPIPGFRREKGVHNSVFQQHKSLQFMNVNHITLCMCCANHSRKNIQGAKKLPFTGAW